MILLTYFHTRAYIFKVRHPKYKLALSALYSDQSFWFYKTVKYIDI